MKIVICQRPSSGSQYAKWVRELIPDCRLFLVSEKGSKAAEANEGYCDLVLVNRYYSDEFGKALSSIACSGCDRIICNSEDDVERVAAVRSQYAVPGMKLPLAEGFRDKYSMKSLFSAASLPSTDFALVGSGKDLGAFVEEHGPSVVKPRNGAGAFGVHIVETIDDVDRLLQDRGIREEIDGNMLLVEEYLPGDVYHTDVLLQDRIPVFTSVSRYIHKPCMFKEENYGSVMLDNASPKRLEIIDLVGRFAKGLPEDGGVHVLHFEFIDDASGHARCGEVAARVGGGLVKQSIQSAYGFDISEQFVRLELGLPASVVPSVDDGKKTGWLVRTGGNRLRKPSDSDEWLLDLWDSGQPNNPTDAADYVGGAVVRGGNERERERMLGLVENVAYERNDNE